MAFCSGRRAFVTGGGSGIGAAIVRFFSAQGVDVVFTVHPDSALAPEQTGGRPIALDLSDLEATHAAVAANGPFDILVNNAGIDQHAFFTKTSFADWRALLAVNLEAVLATTHAALPAMQGAGYGRIINIASEAGRGGSRGGAVYAAAKGGVIAFTKSIARENAAFGITANVVAPGPIDTPMLRQAVEKSGAKLLDAMRAATLVGRLGTPEDVAAAVLFLASEDAGFVTGEVLGVSGGMGVGQ
jgi:2-hydroxycyclohexanecarboxyl-CoA dehydrogenase